MSTSFLAGLSISILMVGAATYQLVKHEIGWDAFALYAVGALLVVLGNLDLTTRASGGWTTVFGLILIGVGFSRRLKRL